MPSFFTRVGRKVGCRAYLNPLYSKGCGGRTEQLKVCKHDAI